MDGCSWAQSKTSKLRSNEAGELVDVAGSRTSSLMTEEVSCIVMAEERWWLVTGGWMLDSALEVKTSAD